MTMTTALKSDHLIPSISLFFFKIVFSYFSCPLVFLIHFEIIFFISIKNLAGVLITLALKVVR